MFRHALRQHAGRLLTPGGSFPGQLGVAAPVIRQLHASPLLGATKDDTLSSGKSPSDSPPDDPQEFGRYADLYMGDLWNKIEAGLRQMEGESFDYNVEMKGGKMMLTLPDSASIVIEKDSSSESLVVHSNLHDTYGAHDRMNEVAFKLNDGRFETGGEALHSFIEDGLAKHLKVQLDLEPDLDHVYGPDPT